MSRPIGSVRGSSIENPSPRKYLTGWACECGAKRRRCRERVYMNVGTYRRAAALGRVVCLEHVDAGVVERHRTYAIVEMVDE
jgi:hypothetical protein